MRTVTRNALLVIAGLLVVLLALGALPGLVKTGDPYYVEATVAAGSGPAIDGGDLSERRFPYTFGALSAVESGADPARSEPYYTGVVGAGLGGRQGLEGVRKAALGEFSGFDGRSRPGRDRRFDVIGVTGLDEPREIGRAHV